MTIRTITAVYDAEADARQARQQLVSSGLDDDDVRILSHNLTSTSAGSDAGTSDKGIWESIKDFFVGDEDRPAYTESLRRGGYLLTARVDDEHTDEAISLLERTNAIDLDERSEQWRTEGWTASDDYQRGERTSAMGTQPSTAGVRDTADAEQRIPIAEERLRVGKREVERGGVRVRSYVVEEPVHEEVALREERVQVERRPASERTSNDPNLFREETIEVSERGEEAVVSKDAVVTEEVVVRKSADERIKEIDETVRRTEVDVDDNSRSASSTGRSKPRAPKSRK